LDGPTIVVPAANVLSIRYENGTVQIISASPFGTGGVPGLAPGVPITDLPTALQAILNNLPAIPIAGNNLKFIFNGDKWTATVNGENFLAGTIEFESTADGALLTLKQTHIWPGAVGRTAGRIASRIPGGGAAAGALNTAGNIAGAAGAVEASGPVIVLEYRAGPPSSLRLISSSNNASNPAVPKTPVDADDSKLWSLGGSIGTTFFTPLFIATVRGTIAPFRYTFFEFGMDLGFMTSETDYTYTKYIDADGSYNYIYTDTESSVGHYSFYPYARFAFFKPVANSGGFYAGIGTGLMIASYTFPEAGKVSGAVLALEASLGYVFGNGITVSYSLRTNFDDANGKLAAGYLYRFNK
jgi:hypothetical protein